MKVLLVVIDAATPRVVGPAIQTGQLPVLQQLVARGTYRDTCTTIFPSITPAATTSIVTGEYPAASGIVGAAWYEKDSGEVAYYGDDLWVVAREGYREFLDDFLLRLNGDRVTAPTLFEIVERSGLRGASLNYLVYKGIYQHEAKVPVALRLLPGVRRTEPVLGPSIIAIGDFLTTRTMRGKPLKDKSGMMHRFGMDDASTGELLYEMAEDGAFPDFTIAYFADNDYRSHEVGPSAALEVVVRVDRALGRAFDAAGGLSRVLQDTTVIVTSDHSQCEILPDEARAAVHLDRILDGFRQATLGKPWQPGDEIMICPNMRAAQVYFRTPDARQVRKAIALALAHPGIEHALVRGTDIDGLPDHFWAESARGQLEFWRGMGASEHAPDRYGTTWSWAGDLGVLDLRLEHGCLVSRDYPNALERIAGVLEHPHSATLWLTAAPGCEFEVPGGAAHLGGGSHGGLHALESYCPLIVAGPERVELPEHVRTVDVAPLCLRLLGLPSRHRVGDARRAR